MEQSGILGSLHISKSAHDDHAYNKKWMYFIMIIINNDNSAAFLLQMFLAMEIMLILTPDV